MGSSDTGASDGTAVEAAELRAVVHHEDGSHWAEVWDCPGLFATGDSLDELVEALAEAWRIWHDDADLPLRLVRAKLVPEVNELRVRIPVGTQRSLATLCSGDMTIHRMDSVLIVVEDLEAAKAFFVEPGMELEGEAQVEGPRADRVVGLDDVRRDRAVRGLLPAVLPPCPEGIIIGLAEQLS